MRNQEIGGRALGRFLLRGADRRTTHLEGGRHPHFPHARYHDHEARLVKRTTAKQDHLCTNVDNHLKRYKTNLTTFVLSSIFEMVISFLLYKSIKTTLSHINIEHAHTCRFV